jgi:hypothetical protein
VSSITGTPIQYAGGGGGGEYNTSAPSPLGVAGGGNGGIKATIGTTGFANTGGGGGGGGGNGVAGAGLGSSGGSGIVVIRYPAYLAPATAVGANTYISGPYRVYVWVSSGSITF